MAKIEYSATVFDINDEWQDSSDGLSTEVEAITVGKSYLSGAKDGSYVVVAKIENVKRVERGNLQVKASSEHRQPISTDSHWA